MSLIKHTAFIPHPKIYSRLCFSLIELLLIISIFLALLTFLSPAYARLIRNSEQLQCKNNLKTIYNSINIYAEDNGDFLPGPVWYGQKANILTNKPSGFNFLPEFLINYFPAPITSASGIKYNPVFICPTNENFTLSKPIYSRVIYRTNNIKGFGIPFGRKASNQKPRKMLDLPNAKGFLLQDADDINYPYYLDEMPDLPVHMNLTRNTLFADGRIEAIFDNLIEID